MVLLRILVFKLYSWSPRADLVVMNYLDRLGGKEYKGNNAWTKKKSRQSLKRFTFCVKSSDSIFFLLGLSPIVNWFDIKSLSRGKYCLIHLEIVKRPKKGNYYVEIMMPPTLHNFILFELDFNVKFPLLHLL